MPRIPDDVIERLKSEVSLQRLAESQGLAEVPPDALRRWVAENLRGVTMLGSARHRNAACTGAKHRAKAASREPTLP